MINSRLQFNMSCALHVGHFTAEPEPTLKKIRIC